MPKFETIAIIGPGKLGSALARGLHEAGYRIAEIGIRDGSRNRKAAAQLARRVRATLSPLSRARLDAPVVWLAIPDDAIAACAAQLARRPGWRGRIVLHSSGALASHELAPLRRRGAAIGSAHPMMTFARGAPASWRGIPFAIEGDPAALAFATRVARRLGMNAFTISARSKPLYHAVGSFSSPILVALFSVTERVARAAGIAKPPREITGRILTQTLEHYLRAGAAQAFAGPMQRGDLATIRHHLHHLRRVPGALEIYCALAAEAARHLPVKCRAALLKLLRN